MLWNGTLNKNGAFKQYKANVTKLLRKSTAMKEILAVFALLLVCPTEAQIDCVTLEASGTPGTSGPPAVSVSASVYSQGNDVTVTVQGSYTQLLLQARNAYSGDSTPLGSFVNPTGGATLSSCSSQDDSVVVSSATADVAATWMAPSTDLGDIVFIATVIQSPDIVWTKLQSPVIISTGYHAESLLFKVTFLRTWSSEYANLASTQSRALVVPLLQLVDNSVQSLVPSYVGSKVIENRGDNIRSIVRMDFSATMNLEEETEIAITLKDAFSNAGWSLSVQNIGTVSIQNPIDMFVPPGQTSLSVPVDDVCFLFDTLSSCTTGYKCVIRTGLPVCECDLTQGSCSGVNYGTIQGSGEDPMAGKYGTCPAITISCAQSVSDCTWDDSCPDNQLCCDDNCGGKVCSTPDPIPSVVAVRLVSGSYNHGILEVKYEGSWGMVCADGWDNFDTQIVCSRMGFPAGNSIIPRLPQYQTTSTSILMDNVQCTGSESHLGQCQHRRWSNTRCNADDTVAVYCSDLNDEFSADLSTNLLFSSLGSSLSPRQAEPAVSDLKETPLTREQYRQDFRSKVERLMVDSPIATSVEKPTISNNGGFVHVKLMMRFPRVLNSSEQLLAAFHLRDRLEASNWTVTIGGKASSVTEIMYTCVSPCSVSVSLMDNDMCAVFDAKGTCINGGVCEVTNGFPYCKCLDGYKGSVCETVLQYNASSSTSTTAPITLSTMIPTTQAPPSEPPVGDEHDITLINGGCTWGFVYATNDATSGHICDTNWRDVNADVICRHAGYSYGTRIEMNEATLTSPVVMDNIICDGSEPGLQDCPHADGTVDCDEGHVIAVLCDLETDEVTFLLTTDLSYNSSYDYLEQGLGYDLRLVITDLMDTVHKDFLNFRDSRLTEVSDEDGLSVLHINLVFTVKMDWDEQMETALSSYDTMSKSDFTFTVDLDNSTLSVSAFLYKSPVPVSCDNDKVFITPSTEICAVKDALNRCANGGLCDRTNSTKCLCPEGFTGPVCQHDVDECTEGTHRCTQQCQNVIGSYQCSCLQGYELAADGYLCNAVNVPITLEGGNCFAGRLTAMWKNEKGTICDRGWDDADLEVACRQLGFDDHFASFSADVILTTQPPTGIWLADFSCSDKTSSLGNCAKSDWNGTKCSHSDDVGIICKDLHDKLMFTLQLDLPWYSMYSDLNDELTVILIRELQNAIAVIYGANSLFDIAKVKAFSKHSDGTTNAHITVTITQAIDKFMTTDISWVLVDHLASNNFSFVLDTNGSVVVLELSVALGQKCGGSKNVPILQENKCVIMNYLGVCLGDSVCFVNAVGQPECSCPPGVSGKYCHIWSYRQVELNLSNGGYAWGLVTFAREGDKGLICGDNWKTINDEIICNDLGFPGGRRIRGQRKILASDENLFLSDLQCDGSETDLGWCNYTLKSECPDNNFVMIQCNDVFDSYEVTIQTDLNWQTSFDTISIGLASDLKTSLEKMLLASYGDNHNIEELIVTSLRETGGTTTFDLTLKFSQQMDVYQQSVSAHHLQSALKAARWSRNIDGVDQLVQLTNFDIVFEHGQQNVSVPLINTDVCKIYNEKKVCEMKNAVCSTNNGLKCLCVSGYKGDLCDEDVDECLENKNTCTAVGQECLNIPGSFSCHCSANYTGFPSEPFCEPVAIPARLGTGGHFWGRMEISNDGQWGTVCDDQWTMSNSKVACLQLGFSGVFDTFQTSSFLSPTSSNVWFDDISCTGEEVTLSKCDHGRWGDVACNHDNDLGLICKYSQAILIYDIVLDTTWNLEYTDQDSVARVQISEGIGEMLTHTDFISANVGQFSETRDGTTMADIQVAFKTALDDLEQTRISFLIINGIKEKGGALNLPENVTVLDFALRLPDAWGALEPVSILNENECIIFNTLGSCFTGSACEVNANVPVCRCPLGRGGKYCHQTSIEVKLADGNHYYGRLEVKHHASWGMVCASNFGMVDADVACTQMGFNTGAHIIFQASKTLPASVDTAVIKDFQCQGSEDNLGLCSHGAWEEAKCPVAEVGVVCSFQQDVVEFRFGLAIPFIAEYETSTSPESLRLFNSLIVQIEALLNGTGMSVAQGKNIVQDLDNVYVTIKVKFQPPLTIIDKSVYSSLVASYITKEGGDITVFVEGAGERESFVDQVHVIIPRDNEAPATALIYPEDPCAVFNALSVCEIGNSSCHVMKDKAQCSCRPGYTEAQHGDIIIAESRNTTLTDIVKFCEAIVTIDSPKDVTSESKMVMEFRMDMTWKNIYADFSNNVTQKVKSDIESFLEDVYTNEIHIGNKTFASVHVLSFFAGSLGVVHTAEWLENLSPMEQEGITMDLLNFMMQDGRARDGRTMSILGTPAQLVGREIYIRYEGALPGIVDTIKVDGPCSVFDGRKLCMNEAKCVAEDDTPLCQCTEDWSGQFCQIPKNQIGDNWQTILSSDSVGKNKVLIIAISSLSGILVIIAVTMISAMCHIRTVKNKSGKERRGISEGPYFGSSIVSRFNNRNAGWLPGPSHGVTFNDRASSSSSRMASSLAAIVQESDTRGRRPPLVSAHEWLNSNHESDSVWPYNAGAPLRMTRGYGFSSRLFTLSDSETPTNKESRPSNVPKRRDQAVAESDSTASWPYQASSPTRLAKGFGYTSRQYRHSMGYY